MIGNSHLLGLHCPKFELNRVFVSYSLVLVNGNLSKLLGSGEWDRQKIGAGYEGGTCLMGQGVGEKYVPVTITLATRTFGADKLAVI